jgi:hypothetical protein
VDGAVAHLLLRAVGRAPLGCADGTYVGKTFATVARLIPGPGSAGAPGALAAARSVHTFRTFGGGDVYWAIAIILGVLWVMGIVTGSTAGAWVHLFLILGLVSLILAVTRSGKAAALRRTSARSATPRVGL